MNITDIFGPIFILFLICMGISGYFYEKKIWNNGKCSKCQSQWNYFDSTSQGDRGYKCDCDEYIWISYPWIDRNQKLIK